MDEQYRHQRYWCQTLVLPPVLLARCVINAAAAVNALRNNAYFLAVILVDRSWQDAPSALWTFIATSFGLTISAITQSLDKQLSFFQALQVMNLVWYVRGSSVYLTSSSRRVGSRTLAFFSRWLRSHVTGNMREKSERLLVPKERRSVARDACLGCSIRRPAAP